LAEKPSYLPKIGGSRTVAAFSEVIRLFLYELIPTIVRGLLGF